MLRFNKDGFAIEINEINGSCPIEMWLNIYEDILGLLQDQGEDMMDKHFYVLYLLKEMMPSWDMAKKMK